MDTPIRRCEEHGFFRGQQCPDCGTNGTLVCSDDDRADLSRFMTWALRHAPNEAGIQLDDHGWTDVTALVNAAQRHHNDDATRLHLAAVVALDEKGRFDASGNRVRAAYGHDDHLDVTIDDKDGDIPDTLYHGTAPRNKDAILNDGLKPMGRAAVHLTDDRDDAIDVGNRHAADDRDPVLFAIDVDALEADGHAVSKKGTNVYTVDHVPPAHLDLL